jgi:hypothetical protein
MDQVSCIAITSICIPLEQSSFIAHFSFSNLLFKLWILMLLTDCDWFLLLDRLWLIPHTWRIVTDSSTWHIVTNSSHLTDCNEFLPTDGLWRMPSTWRIVTDPPLYGLWHWFLPLDSFNEYLQPYGIRQIYPAQKECYGFLPPDRLWQIPFLNGLWRIPGTRWIVTDSFHHIFSKNEKGYFKLHMKCIASYIREMMLSIFCDRILTPDGLWRSDDYHLTYVHSQQREMNNPLKTLPETSEFYN